MNKISKLIKSEKTWVIYDGDCPFCSMYTSYMRFQKSVGKVALINAREHGGLVNDCLKSGYNLNDGMIFIYQSNVYYGDSAVTAMAMLSTSSGLFNKVNSFVFSRRWLSKVIYPALVFARKLVLRLLGKSALE